MGMEANTTYIEAVEAAEIIGELLTYPHPDWARIGALAERIQRIADEQVWVLIEDAALHAKDHPQQPKPNEPAGR